MRAVRRSVFFEKTRRPPHELAMNELWIVAVALLAFFALTTVSASHLDADGQRTVGHKESGLKGTTSSKVVGGIPNRQPTERRSSLEFAIAPIEGGNIAYQKAIFVTSDSQGQYRIVLPPVSYWIGPKAKAMNPTNYRPRAKGFAAKEVVVVEGAFTEVDLLEVG